MTGDQKSRVPMMMFEHQRASINFMPNLCSAAAVFTLVLVGELLAVALVLARSNFAGFDWTELGMISILIQWVALTSAATLCLLRGRLNLVGPAPAVTISYIVIVCYTTVFSAMGMRLLGGNDGVSLQQIATNVAIAAIFAGVVLRYMYLQALLKRKEQAELNARVQALQSRIRPHFLFNSLNSIASLIAINAEEAEDRLVDLAHLFRASLQSPQLIPIGEEIDLCRRFAEIEKARLRERLNLDWQIEALPEGTQILNLLLQPLLENAIYHGIQPLPDGGTVQTNIKVVKHDVVVKITNPRISGQSRSTLLGEDGSDSGNGIALGNIRRRLEAFYSRDAYLRVVKGETDFTVVVRYPLRSSD